MAEAADLLGGPRHPDFCCRAGSDHVVEYLGPAQMVADETDAADALHQHRRLPVRVALNELLETAELDDVQPGIDDIAVVVKVHGHLAVALDPGDRVDDELLAHAMPPRSVIVVQRAWQRDRTTLDQV